MLSNLFRREKTTAESALYRAEVLTDTFTRLLSVQLNERELLQNVVDSIVEKLGFKACFMALVRDYQDGQILSIVAYKFNAGIGLVRFGDRLSGSILDVGQKIAGVRLMGASLKLDKETAKVNIAVDSILRQQAYRITHDLGDLFCPVTTREVARTLQTLAGIRALATVQLRDRHGRLIGNVYVGTERGEITQEQIADLQTFALAASVAIHNVQQLRETMRMGLLASSIGDVAHRVSNVLGLARWDIDDILETMSDNGDEVVDKLTGVRTQVVNAIQIIKDLRETSNKEKEDTAIDIHASLRWAVATLRDADAFGYEKPAGIQVIEKYAPQTIYVTANANTLGEVFRILMKNGCEAMEENGTLTVSTELDEEKQLVVIKITDTGPGIPADKREGIFKMKASSSAKKGGLGYGLWSAHLRVKWFNGDLDFTTKTADEGSPTGTTFIIMLPVVEFSGNIIANTSTWRGEE